MSFINIDYKSLKTKDKNLNCCTVSLHSHRIDVGTEDAVVRDGGPRDLDLERDVIQREETAK